jgi:putative ATP-dependent endonuclease of OLD family
MPNYGTESGVAVTSVRVSNFRSLTDIEVELGALTVLLGANNAGKTSFLDAVHGAIGSGRRVLGVDDVLVGPGEAFPPQDRAVTIDILVKPIAEDGKVADKFPAGSFWVELWGPQIILDDDFKEMVGLRTKLVWSPIKGDYAIERKFLKEWLTGGKWLEAPTSTQAVLAAHIEPLSTFFIDAKRDLEEDVRRPGSFWRRLTDDLGLPDAQIAELEKSLSEINEKVVENSAVLKHLRTNLRELSGVVEADENGIDVSPVARSLRDLARGVDVSFSTPGAPHFPLARHGMGTRSLAALLVFRAFASWKAKSAKDNNERLHSVLALEEPESHLHPHAQRSLFKQIEDIPGQRLVSTHSPYLAAQAELGDLRLFIKDAGLTVVSTLPIDDLTDPDDQRKVRETVIESRGDVLFASGVVTFEGQTEEQALPIWAEAYWGMSIHALGLSFVRANGTQYFPLVWLAKKFRIPWFIFADGEAQPVQRLDAALEKAGEEKHGACSNVLVLGGNTNFESMLIAHGYQGEIEIALNEVYGSPTSIDDFIGTRHGTDYPKNKGKRDYKSAGGRDRAIYDSMGSAKTKLAKPLARSITGLKDPARRFPPPIAQFFELVGKRYGLKQCEASKK